ILGAPRIRIVGHLVAPYFSLLARACGSLHWIVKLIGHAKSTHAAQGYSTLFNGEEAAIAGTETTIAGCLKHRWHHNERHHNLGREAHGKSPRCYWEINTCRLMFIRGRRLWGTEPLLGAVTAPSPNPG